MAYDPYEYEPLRLAQIRPGAIVTNGMTLWEVTSVGKKERVATLLNLRIPCDREDPPLLAMSLGRLVGAEMRLVRAAP